jgi:transcriptional antiterminator NusG
MQGAFEHMAWYAIHVRTGSEDKVCEEIRKQLARVGFSEEYQLLVPKRKLQEKRQGEWNEVVRTMFPGYVLVESEDVRGLARETRKCKGVLRYLESEGKFQEVNLEEIAQIVFMTGEKGIIGISEISFSEEGLFTVISGPLKGYERIIKKIDKRKQRAIIHFLLCDQAHLMHVSITIVSKRN